MLLQERDERLEEEEEEEEETYIACCAGKQAVIAERAAREARWEWSLDQAMSWPTCSGH